MHRLDSVIYPLNMPGYNMINLAMVHTIEIGDKHRAELRYQCQQLNKFQIEVIILYEFVYILIKP